MDNNFISELGEKITPSQYVSSKKKIIYIILISLFLFYLLFISAPRDFISGTMINIEEGKNLRNISLLLKEKDVIRSRLAFEAFVIIYGGEKHLVSADYFFEERIPVFEVARRISKGERHLAPVKVTIPEGFNIAEIVEAFSTKLPNFNRDKFLLNAKEGYLFPDTYFFFTDGNEQDVLKAFSSNYKNKIAPLLPEISASRKTEKDIIIMASIIEKEAKGASDRYYISGILWKRLSINMPLQVDAAPITYKERGLPKNPIANPGLDAIKASIHPKASKYLYYLHDKDGGIHYAQNFEEHKRNKAKYLNN